ncbi:MAG TPA: DUF1489 domain-containing protein [Stellaceae bacterium]|jgi:hypothetical protein
MATADQNGGVGPLHLVKLAVGVGDLDDLRRIRAERLAARGWSAIYTRNQPRRSAAVLAGGSIYWVIKGRIRVRQRVTGFRRERDESGRRFCLIEVDPVLVPTLPRPFRAFQGWRYLPPADAPADIPSEAAGDFAAMPEAMLRELRALGLI